MTPLFPPFDYESLSYEERIRRIGAILGKAVNLRMERKRTAVEGNGEAAPPPESDDAQPSGHRLSAPEGSADPLTG